MKLLSLLPGSNQPPTVYKTVALPHELNKRKLYLIISISYRIICKYRLLQML